MTDDDRLKRALDLHTELTKQLLTLSTGILAVTVTFAKDILGALPLWATAPLLLAWVIYLASIWYGVETLRAAITNLDPSVGGKVTPTDPAIVAHSKRQIETFLAALALTISFGCLAWWTKFTP